MNVSNCPKCGKNLANCPIPLDCYYRADVPDKKLKDFIFKPKKKLNMKNVLRAIRNTLSGDNKVGEVIHGVLDLLPIPNQAFAKLFKALLSGNKDEAKAELGNIFTVRNIIASVVAVLILTGVITVDQVKDIVNVFNEVAGLL